MKKIIIPINLCFLFIIGLLSANAQTYTLISSLDGSQEVPAVNTMARGVGAIKIEGDTLCISLVANGLTGPIMGAHIHEGAAGTNGGVIFDLTSGISGNKIQTKIGGVTTENLRKFLAGQYYFNLHTSANMGGEIRGQIMIEKDMVFAGNLSGANEVPPVTTNAMGSAITVLAATQDKLYFNITFNSLNGTLAAAHLHSAAAGANGNVVADLGSFINGNSIIGTLDPTNFLNDLLMGNIYVNIHTSDQPGGEIRAQLTLTGSGLAWYGVLSGSNEVPAVTSNGIGAIAVWTNDMMDSAWYWGSFDTLDGTFAAAHFHDGAPGSNGGVINMLNVNGNVISGTLTGSSLPADLIGKLQNGLVYVNVHSSANPSGELRANLMPSSRMIKTAYLTGDQEVPAVTTDAYGFGVVSLSNMFLGVNYWAAITNLSSMPTMAHFHQGARGMSGNVLHDFGSNFMVNGMGAYISGTWTENAAMGAITQNAYNEFVNNTVYFNIHTSSNPGGEVRGQVDNMFDCSMPSSSLSVQKIQSLNIYPNPSNGFVNLDEKFVNSTLKIVDVMGKEVKTIEVNSTQLNISDLAPGIYFLSINQSNEVYSAKVIKY